MKRMADLWRARASVCVKSILFRIGLVSLAVVNLYLDACRLLEFVLLCAAWLSVALK